MTQLFEIIGHSRCCSSPLQYRKRITKNGGDAKCNTDAVGKRLSEKVLYSIKDMATQGSSAIRGVTESSMQWRAFMSQKIFHLTYICIPMVVEIGKAQTSKFRKV